MFNPNIINKTYTLGDYQGDTRLASNRFIILHESGNDNDKRDSQALLHEVQFMHNNYGSAYVQFFVGYMDDKAQVYQIGEPGYVSWGALTANPYAPVQIEFARTGDKQQFREAYRLYVEVARYYANAYGIPLTLDSGGNGIKTHQWVTNNFGGDHVDPYPYFASMGITKSQLAYDLANGFDDEPEPEKKATINNVVTVTADYFKAFTTTNSKGVPHIGTDILSGTAWQSADILVRDKKAYFKIGNDTYIPQSVTDKAGKIVINYLDGYGVNAYNSKGQSIKDSNQVFKGGTSWATGEELFKVPNVGWCYQVSTDEYIPVKFQQGSGFKG